MIYLLLILVFLLSSFVVFPIGVGLDYSDHGRKWYVVWMWMHIPVPAFVRRMTRKEEKRLLKEPEEADAGQSVFLMIRNMAESMRGGREAFESGLAALRAVTHQLKIHVLRLNVVVATPNPALTGFAYGMAWAGIGAFAPPWPGSMDVDFTRTTPKVDFQLEARITLITLVPAFWRLAPKIGAHKRQFRRRT